MARISATDSARRRPARITARSLGPLGFLQLRQWLDRQAGQGRSARTTSLLLFVVRSVFGEAPVDGLIAREPSARVKATGRAPRAREALPPDELSRLRPHLSSDPLAALWTLTLYGLRRSEVMSLRWSDVDLSTGMLSIERGVTDDHGKRSTVATAPKTSKGRRTLPLPPDTVTGLRALRDAQARAFGLGHIRTGYLAVDPAGRPPARGHRQRRSRRAPCSVWSTRVAARGSACWWLGAGDRHGRRRSQAG
jgi:integrase